MFTYEVAWSSFDEKEHGSLEIGKIADMMILNQNPLKLEPKALRSLKVEKLFLTGKEYEPGMGLMETIWNSISGRKEKI